MESIWDTSILADYFKYENYNGIIPRDGWLLNYHMKEKVCPDTKRLITCAILYFIDSKNENFRVEVPFPPKILVEAPEHALSAVEDYLIGKYQDNIKTIGITKRIDLQKVNHLASDGSQYLILSMYSEKDSSLIKREVEEIARRNLVKKKEDATSLLFAREKRQCNEPEPEEFIKNVYEYDIPVSVQMAIELNINAGKWYTIEYNGKYTISESSKVIPPDLRIFSFDIETTKDPLKFPSADKDQIMMISVMTTLGGWLLINREIVGADIQPFEFRPTSDIGGEFDIFNEKNEKNLLNKFMELLHTYKPHVITTYNGDFFDWPFVEKRLEVHGINLYTSLGFKNNTKEEYVCDYILHLDCYKWVKRDSYLPAGSQGLKSVTKAKLGYFPDEIDPENMVHFARTNPKLMASYSVSDAIATHFLYLKYVHPFIFSLASLIPLPPDDVLRKGSGTLCETLLVKEAYFCHVLIPEKKRAPLLHNYNGRMAESISYVGGHVECLKSGIYRSDFEYEFIFNKDYIDKMINEVESIVDVELKGKECLNKKEVVEDIQNKLRDLASMNKAYMKPHIYHLDVGAMYPNIILTNRLQPSAITDEKKCGQCIYAEGKDICQRKMNWKGRAEVLAVDKKSVETISKSTREAFYKQRRDLLSTKGTLPNQKSGKLPRFEEQFKNNLIEHAKNTSKKTREIVIEDKKSIICQRENPFYVNAVRKFRDRRNEYKRLAKQAKTKIKEAEAETGPGTETAVEWAKKAGIYDSLQIAHKCVLNSFYGYVMKKGARWHSMEMAAVVCQTGSSIIQNTKTVIDAFGVTLELDTDGIWALLPESFPLNYTLNTKEGPIGFSYICSLLNYMLLDLFSNHQYQIKEETGEYTVTSENSIQFEIDGPYRAMFLPGSTKQGESIKKRYIVINNKEKISELKGFEFKRRGELKFVKSFQEEMFNLLLSGNTLEECYMTLAECADYWIDIIETKAQALAQDEIFNYFGETRNMSKSADALSMVKTTCLTAAERLSELLGQNVVVKGMSCSFIISKYPENEPVTSRAIPQSVFYAEKSQKEKYLQKWLKMKTVPNDIREIIDWSYYLERLSNIIARIIIIPASLQGLKNPVSRVNPPQWAVHHKKITEFFKKSKDTAENINSLNSIRTVQALNKPEKSPVEENKGHNQSLVDFLRIHSSTTSGMITENENPSKDEMSVIAIKKITSYAFTVVYVEGKKLIEKEIKQKKTFYLHADTSVLDRSITTYTALNSTEVFVQKVVKYAVGITGKREFVRVVMDPVEFNSKFHKYTNLFESPEIKGIYELDVPKEVRALSMVRFKRVPVYVITTCTSEGKTIYALYTGLSKSPTCRIPEVFEPSTEGVHLFNNRPDLVKYLKSLDLGIVFYTKNSSLSSIKVKHCVMAIDVLVTKTIHGSSTAIPVLMEVLNKAVKKAQKQVNICEFANIPILPIEFSRETLVLDYLHYKERESKHIIGWNDTHYKKRIHYTPETSDENPFKKELYREGVYEGISVGVSVTGSVLLCIIEADTLMKEERANFKQGIEMEAMQSLIKKVVYHCIKKTSGAQEIANNIPYWVRSIEKTSSVTEFISSRISLLQIKFISGIVSGITRSGGEVIAADGEDLIIHTGQFTKHLAQVHLDQIFTEVSNLSYGSLLRLRVSQWYKRVLMVDQANYQKILLLNDRMISTFIHPIPSIIINDLLKNDDLSALEYIKEVYMQSTSNGFTITRLLIKIYGLKYKSPEFARKSAKIVQLSPFSEEILRPFGEFTTVTIECQCSATSVIHSPHNPITTQSEIDQFFNELIQHSQRIDLKCKKCLVPFTRLVIEESITRQIHAVTKRVVKMERKCSVCKKPSVNPLATRCTCGGRLSREVKHEINTAIRDIISICTIAPTITIIIYAKTMIDYLTIK
ncbi:DNA polymerase epsilon subunit 1 [Nematocida sp. AWRm78]|nr:DNA polymerase epsilon subunit 1 [Nematocida sp. AWRm79]KAI5183371.1 DNA polymerase epsilon subunit 1 [Nematocida sp. AWRm78]